MSQVNRTCVGCNVTEGKYKCPRCSQYTCSVACSRQHRDMHAAEEPEPKPQSIADVTKQAATPDAIVEDADQLAHLPEEQRIFIAEAKKLFMRYPKLRSRLAHIAAATEPPSEESHMNGNPAGQNHPRKKKEVWTKDLGMQKAIARLQVCREDAEDYGLEEYCELVRVYNARRDAEANMRRELGEHDAREISRLLHEEQRA